MAHPLVRWLNIAAAAASLACGATDDGEGDGLEDTGTVSGALTLNGYVEPTAAERAQALQTYAHVDRGNLVPRDLLERVLGFVEVNKSKLRNDHIVSVVDFAKHSSKKRFFIIDLASGIVEPHVVAHGIGSDPNHTGYAKRFSNVSGSNASSLGYYVTGETYQGNNGYSLRLDGVSDTNSRARDRAVVIHGAAYVSPGRDSQGRSQGCFAFPDEENDDVIRKVRGGTVIYAERSGAIDE